MLHVHGATVIDIDSDAERFTTLLIILLVIIIICILIKLESIS